ncbi:MAG: dUTPase [Nitrososphaeraceae archaeon]
MDKLDTLYKMQKDLAKVVISSRYPKSQEQRISSLSIAIIHEAVELQRLTNWKWWKSPSNFDIDSAKEELIDILHFVLQASIELGMNPSEILHEYSRKHDVNKERQTSNY